MKAKVMGLMPTAFRSFYTHRTPVGVTFKVLRFNLAFTLNLHSAKETHAHTLRVLSCQHWKLHAHFDPQHITLHHNGMCAKIQEVSFWPICWHLLLQTCTKPDWGHEDFQVNVSDQKRKQIAQLLVYCFLIKSHMNICVKTCVHMWNVVLVQF